VVDGLKGFPEAITSVFPQTVVQTCILHLIRNSLAFVSWKDRKAMPECAGGEAPSGRPPWGSLRFSSARVFRDRRDDPGGAKWHENH
jgi:hypothetical protein